MPVTLDDIINESPTCGGRASTAILEAKRLMEYWLPQVLARVNADSQANPSVKTRLSIPIPNGYYLAGTPINSEWPNVIIGWSVEGSPMAMRTDQDHVHLALYMAYQHIQSEAQLLNCMDACFWMRNIIMRYRKGHRDPEGLKCWKELIPGGIARAPKRFPEYEGLAYQCVAWQPGDTNTNAATNGTYWAPPTTP